MKMILALVVVLAGCGGSTVAAGPAYRTMYVAARAVCRVVDALPAPVDAADAGAAP